MNTLQKINSALRTATEKANSYQSILKMFKGLKGKAVEEMKDAERDAFCEALTELHYIIDAIVRQTPEP
jgi:molecular chaperone GrpE (heat shock protein)